MQADPPVADRSLPPKPHAWGGGVTARRWIVTLIALAVLAAIAAKGYFWFTGDVARRKALVAVQESEPIAVPPPVEVQGLAAQPDAAASVADLGNLADPDQHRAVCAYLVAEQERLDHEFKQPLPPPVVDRIATEIAQLHTQTSRADCTPGNAKDAPHAAADRRSAAAAD